VNKEFLNDSIIHEINNILDTGNYGIYNNDNNRSTLLYSAFCRIVSSYEYLKHKKFPNTEELVILYMNYCCIMIDAINICLSTCNIERIDTHNYFKDISLNKLKIPEEMYKNDEMFFEFFRSLVFAHPIDTDRSLPINKKNKIKYYAPYVLFNDNKKSFGVMVFNQEMSLISLVIELESLKGFVNENFERLNEIIRKIVGKDK
jgi:hypothetical protein